MPFDISQAFKIIGLGIEHSQIYTLLLNEGEHRIIDIAKKTGLPRTSCYEYIPKLKELSLIQEEIIGKSKFYKITDPQNFISIMYKHKNDFAYVLSNIENEFFSLQEKYRQNQSVFFNEVIEGVHNIKSYLSKNTKSKVLAIYCSIEEFNGYDDELSMLLLKFIDKNKPVLQPLNNSTEKTQLKLKNTIKIVFDDKIMIVNLTKNSAIIISEAGLVELEKATVNNY